MEVLIGAFVIEHSANAMCRFQQQVVFDLLLLTQTNPGRVRFNQRSGSSCPLAIEKGHSLSKKE
ncbi:MAG: hypothetical protein ABI967_16225, partial [bacterium]